MPNMFTQMDAVCHRFEELSIRLNQPDTAADPALFRRLMREYHDAEPVVQAYRAWQTAQDHLAQAKALLEEPGALDPDFKQMIQQEISEKSQDVEKLENNLKILLLPKDVNDGKNVIVEIRGGAGGEEAALFAHRQAFTMDEKCSKAVREVFVNLYEKGLIYQGNRIINWCPCCKTALSDAEVEYAEEPGSFWQIRYPSADGGQDVIVATTRPETMFGDTAVAVNPADERYTALVGKTLKLPLTNREIPVVADEYVDIEFGTGCVKITPAHDPNDFEVGKRHNLEVIRVMNDDGTMNENAGEKYNGLDRYEARKRVVEDLKAGGYLVSIQPHVHNVGHCYRCHNIVEPIVSKQWFVKMEPLAKPAIAAVMKNRVRFVPERFSKIYFTASRTTARLLCICFL